MASTSYRKPIIQRALAAMFRDQVRAHISACTLQGLEILQGLLIHVTYFILLHAWRAAPRSHDAAMRCCCAESRTVEASKDSS
jgi:hypothetical protein